MRPHILRDASRDLCNLCWSLISELLRPTVALSQHGYVTVFYISYFLLLLFNIYPAIYLFVQVCLTSPIKWQAPEISNCVLQFIFLCSQHQAHVLSRYSHSSKWKLSMLILKPLLQFCIYKYDWWEPSAQYKFLNNCCFHYLNNSIFSHALA